MKQPNPFRGGFSLRGAAAPKPAPAAKGALGLVEVKDGEAEGQGIVKGIRMGDNYDGISVARAARKLAQVTIQFGEDPPQLDRKQRDKMDWEEREALRPPTSTFDVPPSVAKDLAIGDKVRVCIEKVGK